MGIINLITAGRSAAEAAAFKEAQLSEADVQLMADAGRDVLMLVPPALSPNACAHMAAMWARRIARVSAVPVYVTAGNLAMHGRKIYHSDLSAAALRAEFAASSLAYDGHFWLSIPGGIGEIALFRSAYSEPEGHWFRRLVTQEFGPKRGLFIGRPARSMAYDPKYLLTPLEIDGLLNGADVLFGEDP